jgi:hypothetical protein
MSKHTNDVRPLSADPRYMGTVFHGSLRSAIAQAKRAPDHGLPALPHRPANMSRDRYNLLAHLNLLPAWWLAYSGPSPYSLAGMPVRSKQS